MTTESVLAATDLSPRADRAVQRAALLAQQRNASLHLLYVLPALTWKMFGKAFVEHPLITEKQLYDSARARLETMAADCVRQYAIPVSWDIEIGRAPERIADYAQSHAVALAVLGPHGENPVRDLFIGATALKVVRKVVCPTLVAVSPANEPYRRVLVAVDIVSDSRAALEYAVQLAPEAPIHVLHVYEISHEGVMHYAGVEARAIEHYRQAAEVEARHRLNEYLASMNRRQPVLPVVQRGRPASTILEQAQTLQADLIVVGKRSRSEFDELFMGSVTEQVLHRLDRDLLLVPER